MGEANQPKYKCFKSTDGAWACGAERVAQETSQMVEQKWLLDPKNAQMLNNNNFNVFVGMCRYVVLFRTGFGHLHEMSYAVTDFSCLERHPCVCERERGGKSEK